MNYNTDIINIVSHRIVNILKVCGNIGSDALSTTKQIHNFLNATPITSTSPSTSSISPQQNIIVFNSLLSAFMHCGDPHHALQLWQSQSTRAFDKFTATLVLTACAAIGGSTGLHVGREVQQKLKQFPSLLDETLFTALVNMYSKCNCPLDAARLWSQFSCINMISPKGTLKLLLKACADVGSKEALVIGQQIQVFTRSLPDSKVDMALHNAIVHMLSRCGDPKAAIEYWNFLASTKSADLSTPIATTMLTACSQLGPEYLQHGRAIFKLMDTPNSRENPLFVAAVINMLAKCGDSSAALAVWDSFMHLPSVNTCLNVDAACSAALSACATIEPPEEGLKLGMSVRKFAELCGLTPANNLRLTNSLILMYARCGEPDTAIQLWQQLSSSQHLQPNAHSFIGVMTACAAKGQSAYDFGTAIYSTIQFEPTDNEQTLSHLYGAIINMFAKCGSWEEAEVFALLNDLIWYKHMFLGDFQESCCVHNSVTRALQRYVKCLW